jgi:CRISPR/Cas system-associated protein Cas10 (large subunit of type III CRISPR-Cas system)
MCPADNALQLAKDLAEQFRDTMSEYNLDGSCGIAVGHYKFPLQRIVEEARKAETRAKNKRGRAAFALTLLKHSGEIIHWGAKWESNALVVYQDFTEKTAAELFSARFPYALAELLAPYRLTDLQKGDSQVALKPIIQKEFEHVQERQALQKGASIERALNYLEELDNETLEDFPNLFLASAFMNRQRGEF